jgi:hypothetical protein
MMVFGVLLIYTFWVRKSHHPQVWFSLRENSTSPKKSLQIKLWTPLPQIQMPSSCHVLLVMELQYILNNADFKSQKKLQRLRTTHPFISHPTNRICTISKCQNQGITGHVLWQLKVLNSLAECSKACQPLKVIWPLLFWSWTH